MLPIGAIVPSVFADRQCDWFSAQGVKLDAIRGMEVASLIEDVVCGEQRLVLAKHDLATFVHGCTVERALAHGLVGTAGVATNNTDIEIRGVVREPLNSSALRSRKLGFSTRSRGG